MTHKSDSPKTILFKSWKEKVEQSCSKYMLSAKKQQRWQIKILHNIQWRELWKSVYQKTRQQLGPTRNEGNKRQNWQKIWSFNKFLYFQNKMGQNKPEYAKP